MDKAKMNVRFIANVTVEESRPANILVVDSNPHTRNFMSRALDEAGYPVDAYASLDPNSGSLDRLGSEPAIQVVLVDSHALDPLEDGPTVSQLRHRSPYRSALQFVVVGEPAHLDRVLLYQMSEVTKILAKPVDQFALTNAISWAIRRHAALRSISGPMLFGPASQSSSRPCRALPADLEILQWIRQIDEQRLEALEGVVEPDATWNMLAELLRARITGQRISVTSLCLASHGPVTSALRRIERLTQDGLVTCSLDTRDRRRKYIELTPEGARRMRGALEAITHRRTAIEPSRNS